MVPPGEVLRAVVAVVRRLSVQAQGHTLRTLIDYTALSLPWQRRKPQVNMVLTVPR